MIQELMRHELVKGNFKYPTDLIKLYPTKHCVERLEQRGVGLDCLPTLVRVTKNNIHSGKSIDGQTLHSVVIRIDYNIYKYLFLCFNPFDGGLKTLWFLDKKKRSI